MKKYILSILIVSLFVGCKGQDQRTKSAAFQYESKVDSYVKKYQALGIFSGAVLIAQDGEPVYSKAFGLANRKENRPNTLETKYLIGSMNKDFTRTIILQLIAEKKLRWEDRMVDYLEGFNQQGTANITIRHLVSHSSGFGDYENWDYVTLPYQKKNLSTIMDIARNQELLFEPGKAQEYSNVGYALLGAIIEMVTGINYVENVKERIVEPLGMKNTYLKDILHKTDRTVGYMKTINGIEDTEIVLAEPRPDGGFWCTPSDLLRFYQNYYYGDKLIPERIKTTDGYYKEILPFYDRPNSVQYLAGGTNGHNSVIAQFLNENISVIVLANMDEPVAEKIADGLVAILKDKEPSEPKLPALLASYEAYKAKGIAYLKDHFEELTSNFYPDDPKDVILNNLGYQLLENDKLEEAFDVLKLNTELFPEIANCWDSYGEILLKKGDRKAALVAYKKALSINPNLPSAQKAVKQLNN
ncbi:MAG TPA: serine hydrolase [Flavobacteriaceae bacterium]|nr:serine hydrolase [Flavobacteriaceae bacterium]MCB9213451.1 serine hydrolase [Alteromonas sp.]HPF12246.1 serine hydrolase [Flavobacteriaceae bacterium]HQU22469.1 serine hydrolase [Flavobacteriaceae bacterium]HRW45644.1 serine hydrolase [Flavobacteriaceae bacterium]